MRRPLLFVALILSLGWGLLASPADAAWGDRLTLTDSTAHSDVKVTLRHQRGQAINVSSTTITANPSAALLRVVWRIKDVTVADRRERLSFAWFDGPESAEARYGIITVVLQGGEVIASHGCPLPAGAVKVKPKADVVKVRVPYACFDAPGHKARVLTITPTIAAITTLAGGRIAYDDPLNSPGAPVKPGVSVPLGRS